MNRSSIDIGRFNGLLDSSFVGTANGRFNNEQMISDNNSFIFTINTIATKTFQLPLASNGTYNFFIDWGDGRNDYVTSYAQIYPRETVARTHTYREVGTYKIKITGICRGWSFVLYTNEQLKILSIERFGCLELTSDTSVFSGCANLNLLNLKDALNVKNLTNANYMFYSTSKLRQFNLINNWNVKNITSMISTFSVSYFNEFIGDWNVSNVNTMNQMFFSNPAFNQDIGDWNVSNVTNMSNMFGGATAFDQNIGNWNVSNVSVFDNFMGTKTPSTFSASNLDAIYNGWILNGVISELQISFGTAKHTIQGQEGKNLLTRWYSFMSFSTMTNNGSGLIRLTGFYQYVESVIYDEIEGDITYYLPVYTGMKIRIGGALGTVEANGTWEIIVVDLPTGTVDLIGSTFVNTYLGGGYITTGYGWTITDGGT
jgi:surface protein